ncbi:hypothetical protein UR09_00720 [Candidatus Nitromaritima sp. SCGC AAA799-A02]|nr:hypothetical protein UR09_00720 [Candidatus Nitromaritima sp. SCGC AAA799-A02]
MKFKGTLGLTVAFIGLVLYYFLIDVPTEERKKEEQARSEKILLFEPDHVESFSIIRKKDPITLKRAGDDAWEVTAPVVARGDSQTASTFLSFLKGIRFDRVVEDAPKDLAVFGLESPSLEISLLLKNGEKKGIRVGDNHPMGNKIYLSRIGESKVLTAGIGRSQLDRQVYDLRDKTILGFNATQITKLECVRGGKTLVIEKQGDTWNLSEGSAEAKGSDDEIMNLLNTLRAARIKEFIEEQPETLEPYGLDRPSLLVTLTDSKADAPLSLSIGLKKDSGFYAKTEAGKNVFVVGKPLFDTLNNSRLVDFMEKSLVDFKEDEIAGLTLRSGDETIRLLRDKKKPQHWTLEEPDKERASTATVNSLLFDLKDVRIEEFVKTFVTDPTPFGLDRPKKELTVTYNDGKDWSLVLGNPTSDGTHQFARRSGEEAVFTIKTADVETLFRTLHDLKDRTLLKFKTEDVKKIELHNPKQTFILERTGKNWRLAQPERIDPIPEFIGNDILWTLNSLQFETVVSSPAGDSATGFTHPRLTVKLWDKKDRSLGQVVVGGPVDKAPERHYLRVNQEAKVYTIKKRFLQEIPDNINKFKENSSSG